MNSKTAAITSVAISAGFSTPQMSEGLYGSSEIMHSSKEEDGITLGLTIEHENGQFDIIGRIDGRPEAFAFYGANVPNEGISVNTPFHELFEQLNTEVFDGELRIR